MRNRRFVKAPVFVTLLLVVGLLAACDKPLPMITVFGGGNSVLVKASAYQFPGGPVRQQITDFGQAPAITVTLGTQLLVDVPRTVADHAWIVSAIKLDAESKETPVVGAGSTLVHNTHSTRLETTPAGLGDYYLRISEFRGSAEVGGWTVRVRTTT